MKQINNLILMSVLFLGLTLAGCDDEPEVSNISRVTFFPTFEYEGGDFAIVTCNTSYTLQPVIATENGVELTTTTTISGTFTGATSFDISVPDKYTIMTSAVNKDGFAGSVTRTVWVVCTGDLVTSLEGLYTATVVRNGAASAQYNNMKYVLISKVGPNQYALSDAIGAYYSVGRGYGDAYGATGIVITANDIPSNNFSFNGPIGVGAFGGNLTMVTMTVDPVAKTIYFESDWDLGFYFAVTLTQVPI